MWYSTWAIILAAVTMVDCVGRLTIPCNRPSTRWFLMHGVGNIVVACLALPSVLALTYDSHNAMLPSGRRSIPLDILNVMHIYHLVVVCRATS